MEPERVSIMTIAEEAAWKPSLQEAVTDLTTTWRRYRDRSAKAQRCRSAVDPGTVQFAIAQDREHVSRHIARRR